MFGQPWPPLAPWPPAPPFGAGAVVEGVELEPVDGLGLAAARAGTESATTAPSVAAPTTGAASSITLRLSGISAS